MTITRTPAAQVESGQGVREADDSRRLFAISGLVAAPLAFLAALLVTGSTGWRNAALFALVFAGFAAAFFFGLYWLAVAVMRDERRTMFARRFRRSPRGSRAV